MRAIRKLFLIAAIFAGLVVSGGARANEQDVLDRFFGAWADDESRELLRHLADCVAERHPDIARRFVLEVGDDVMLLANQEALIDGKCVKSYWFRNSRTAVSAPFYSPQLAEALLKLDFADGPLPSVGDAAALDHPTLPEVVIDTVHPRYREMFIVDKASRRLETVTECAARNEPSLVLQLARTEPDSPEQVQAFASLEPVIARCANGAFEERFPEFVTRGALVMNLYRLAHAARSGAGAVGTS